MKKNQSCGQQLMVGIIFLVSLVLQSCSDLEIPLIPIEKGRTDRAQVSCQELSDTKFIEKEEQVVTCYSPTEQVHPELQETLPVDFSKTPTLPVCTELPVPTYAELDIDTTQVSISNDEAQQKNLVYINLPKKHNKRTRNKRSGYVHVGTRGNGVLALPGYKVLSCLHHGTSSNIYRAIHLADECPVVFKVSSQKALSEEKKQSFRQEFELAQKIHSPYVIRYLELKQDPAYGIALIMEDDHAVELTSFIPPSGFSNHEFLEIAVQIVQGLQAIHEANIIHCDLKLSNILIQPTTKAVKIIDFNCSTTLRAQRKPAIPMLVGTLAYISPEQTGRVNRSVDYRTDFYALGVIFYQLLCDRLPFTATDPLGLIHQHLAKQPLPPHQHKTTIAKPLSQLVMKLLEKEANNRYQSCEGLLHDLTVCLSALNKTGTIPEFKLGQQDFSRKLTLSQHLYGRENEIQILEKAFERVSEGKSEALMVAGQPGVGKTKLIHEIQKPIALKQSYFLTGKFDQLNKNVAYSAVTQAFNNLIQQLLAENNSSINQWKKRLLTALGVHASLLIKVVPALTLLIGEQPEMPITDINQAKNVFNWVFQEFVKVCATASHPLVVFLDDLQWADQASLELMTYLLQQPNINYLLWIGAYRDTEVTSSHPALQAVATLQEAGVCIQTLTLAPLQRESLCRWIADSLRKSLTDIQPLGELIFQKTEGNPFFVKIFLQSLYEEQLLIFSPQAHWQWDFAKIRQHPATDNVITLMTYQIKQLPAATQKALSIASCLGHRLALSTLQTAMDCSYEETNQDLQPALNSGILIQTDSELYFAHDRVQEAVYALLAETDKASTHLTIGKRLLAHLSTEETLLFDIVAQFNRCYLLITEAQERLQIACLYLKAAQKAKQATAYAAGLDHLYGCRNWIDIEALWQTNYPLAFTLHKELAEMEYLNGQMDTSQAIIADMQPRLQSNLDQVDMYHLLIIQKTLQGHYQEAINLGHQALQLLDSGLTLDNPSEFTQKIVADLKQKLPQPISSLLNAPLVVELEKQAIFKILGTIQSTCYQVELELFSAATFMLINLALTYGHVPESCLSYATYGLLLCARFEEYTLGYQFGQLALHLAEKLQSPTQRGKSSMVMLGYIYPWSKTIQQLPTLFRTAYEISLACGDLEFAGYSAIHIVTMLFYQGAPLAKVQQAVLSLLQFAQNTKNQIAINSIQSVQRLSANLRGDTLNEWDFDTNAINEVQFEEGCRRANSSQALCFYHIFKAQAFYLYGYFKQAFDQLNLAKSHLIFILGQYATALFNWYDSLIRLALYPTASHEDQPSYLDEVMRNQQQMQKWQSSCPDNFSHKYLLVEAELARIQGNYFQAETYYDQSIELASQHGFIQEQALAVELAAKYWLARGKSLCAQGYLNTAFNSYKQWGAKRKLMQFKTQYADLLTALAPPDLSQLVISPETTLSSNTLKLLDLSSILKASQAISSEIELPRLLHKMMEIVIENAGAEQGTLLFVEADNTIRVQAEYTKDGTITTLQNILLNDWSNGAQMVIEYVKRLHQSVVVNNAVTHSEFKTDPYISRTQAKSILCVPLLKHTELRAILYVENNLMSHAFTPERVQTVLILTAQMAISLENARHVTKQLELTRQLAEESVRRKIAKETLRVVTRDECVVQ
ncbi:MAG: hypothetical protein BGO68_00170 [Candidatus Amoebophilus sp. 36-38]|nr:MAG: hypothetical protein BGO68_00170 [Candidatus Amoebophilus sp. 36-38]